MNEVHHFRSTFFMIIGEMYCPGLFYRFDSFHKLDEIGNIGISSSTVRNKKIPTTKYYL